EISLAVLHPLEVAGGHAAGVGEDVGNDEDLLFREDIVGGGGGGTVGAFDQDLCLHALGILASDLVLGGGGDEDLAIGGEQVGGGARFRTGKSDDGAVTLLVFEQLLDIDALGIEQAAIPLAHADDLI